MNNDRTNGQVALRPVTMDNFRECVRLKVADEQTRFVATNMQSLAQAYVNRKLTPLVIYGADVWCREPTDDDRILGFVMYQVWDEVGFIMRLMVAPEHQRQGHGRAAMIEVVRRLKLVPQVARIATSYETTNIAAKQLYTALDFTRSLAGGSETGETYVALDWDPD